MDKPTDSLFDASAQETPAALAAALAPPAAPGHYDELRGGVCAPGADGAAFRAAWAERLLPALEASGVKIVIDHFGRPDPKLGVNCEGFQMMLRAIADAAARLRLAGHLDLGGRRAVHQLAVGHQDHPFRPAH